jgi:hypothetical protein
MIALAEPTKASRAAVVVSCTCPLAPPIEISTFLPCPCLALMAAMKSASLSTLGHSATGQRWNWSWPEVGEVGSANARSITSQSAGTWLIGM